MKTGPHAHETHLCHRATRQQQALFNNLDVTQDIQRDIFHLCTKTNTSNIILIYYYVLNLDLEICLQIRVHHKTV